MTTTTNCSITGRVCKDCGHYCRPKCKEHNRYVRRKKQACDLFVSKK